MAHKRSLEALDRTLKDLRNNNPRFGGVMILLASDEAADELNACLKASYLWRENHSIEYQYASIPATG